MNPPTPPTLFFLSAVLDLVFMAVLLVGKNLGGAEGDPISDGKVMMYFFFPLKFLIYKMCATV